MPARYHFGKPLLVKARSIFCNTCQFFEKFKECCFTFRFAEKILEKQQIKLGSLPVLCYIFAMVKLRNLISVADPGFPVGGGRGPRRRGCGLPRQLRFENFVCQNERIGTLRGARTGHAPLDPPMNFIKKPSFNEFTITKFKCKV